MIVHLTKGEHILLPLGQEQWLGWVVSFQELEPKEIIKALDPCLFTSFFIPWDFFNACQLAIEIKTREEIANDSGGVSIGSNPVSEKSFGVNPPFLPMIEVKSFEAILMLFSNGLELLIVDEPEVFRE